MDSLNAILKSSKEDTTRLRLYFSLAHACEVQDNLKYAEPAINLIDTLIAKTIDGKEQKRLIKKKSEALSFIIYYYQRKQNEGKLLEYSQKRLNLCQQIKDSACIYYTWTNMAAHYRGQGNLPKALEYFQKVLSVCIKLNYKEGIARSKAELSDMYLDQRDTVRAIELQEQVLVIVREMNNKGLLARAFMKAGGLYNAIGNYSLALDYYGRARVMFEELKDKQGLMEDYKNSGDTYNAKNDYKNALIDLQKAKQLAEELKKPIAVVNFMGRMANVYANMQDYNKAIKCIDNAIDYNKKYSESGDMQIWLKSRLARIYYKFNDFRKAKYYSDMTLEKMKETNDADMDMDLEKLAAKIDSACGNYKEAYGHYQQYFLLRDKLNSEEVRKAATKERFQNEYDKQKAEDKVEQTKKDLLAAEEKRKQKVIIYSIGTVLLIVLIFSIFIFRSLSFTRKQKQIIEYKERETQKQKQLIEEKQHEIIDSISYAKRLQHAILPPKEFISSYLPDSFVLYKPKDIVAGDFYWAEQIGNLFFIAAADSTGHGVPGAMVSVICSTALNRSVKEFKLTGTGEILDKARELVIETFEKSSEEVKDGMDISLLCIDLETRIGSWSGANNPLWYVQDGELKEIKADKQPIGKTDFPKPFTTHCIACNTTTVFYLFTDGLPDQFGGPMGKKFKYKQFENLLVGVSHLPMKEQENKLVQRFHNWKGALEQVDDVCVIGIRI